ncbi:MAG: ABC transporter ATP-binding protein [Clostridia bacterium]|nr:ABC transporter ATP-binding protein [Clostridia bacterium]
MLKIDNLHVSYGQIEVLHGVSIKVNSGETVTLAGSNGAGKSTLLNAIFGIVKPSSGSISYNGKELTRLKAYKIVSEGIAYVPEGRRVFSKMTVNENIMMGAYSLKDKRKIKSTAESVFEIFPRLCERKEQLAGTLSGGEQQMLAIGRAMMSNPETIIMDEPSMGLSPIMAGEVFDIIDGLHKQGVTIFLVEQNVSKSLSVSDRVYTLENGRITMQGAVSEIDESLFKKAYLGA